MQDMTIEIQMSAYSDIDQDFGKKIRTADGGREVSIRCEKRAEEVFHTDFGSILTGSVSGTLCQSLT